TGQLATDLAPGVHQILTVTGQDSKTLLVELSPDVAELLAGVSLPALGVSVGSVVASAGSVGDLLAKLASPAEGLLTVIGEDTSYLLVQLSADVASLVSGLGLPSVGVPVGAILATVGSHIKRTDGRILSDLASDVNSTLTVISQDLKPLVLRLSSEVASLFSGLELASLGVPLGSVIASASTVADLVNDTAPDVRNVVSVVDTDGSALLVKLSGPVVSLVVTVGLPSISTPIGTIVKTAGTNL
ncbi:hypothetical protein ASPZODRAFT_47295, partial [Penicilliopsis zonata CBS 506.65]